MFSFKFWRVLVIFAKVSLMKWIFKSLLASEKLIFWMTLIFMIALSFSEILQCFKFVQWLLLRLLQFKLSMKISSVCSGWCALHFTHTGFSLVQVSFKCPYFWQLWHHNLYISFHFYFIQFFILDESLG